MVICRFTPNHRNSKRLSEFAMDIRNVARFVLFLIVTTALAGPLQELARTPYTVSNKFLLLHEDYGVEVDNKGNVMVQCYVENVDVTSINVSEIGPANRFNSRSCNLRNQLGQIFTEWGIESTLEWNISGYSDVDFVLKRSEFEDVDVSLVENVRIENSSIIEIELDAFRDFVKLKVVTLRLNKIKVLPDLFKYSQFIRSIDIAQNQLEILPEVLTAPSLLTIYLRKNNLTRLSEVLFSNTPALKVIELADNKIKDLPDKLLQPLTHLSAFNITQNNITQIPPDFFKMNTKIMDIRLSTMNISSVPGNLFEGLTNLYDISLHRNGLESLPENLFYHLTKLHYLDLSDNKLKRLPKTIFRDLKSLRRLSLSNNKLSEWSYDMSMHVRNLHTLLLDGNNFVRIESDYFYSMRSLAHLHLENNNISYIGPATFNGLSFLVLNLSNNSLTNVADNKVSFVDGLPSARELNLDHNLFETLPPLIEYKSKYLSMSHNKLKEIEISDFTFGAQVDLNDNQIEVIDFKHLNAVLDVYDDLFEGQPKISIDIGNNPIMCGCSAYDLIQFFDKTYEKKNIYYKYNIRGNLTCRGPPSLAGRNVRELKSKEFSSCDRTQRADYRYFDGCPSSCYCEVIQQTKTLSLDCSNGNLTRMPPVPVITWKHVSWNASIVFERVQVNLRNNSIEELGKDVSYENVTILDLSNNKLTKVDWIPPILEVLNLSNNTITSLDDATIRHLRNSLTLKKVSLDNNPCDCDFMTELEKIISDKSTGNIQAETKTSNTNLTLLIACLSALIGAALIFIIILYLLYVKRPKKFHYKHNLLTSVINEQDREKGCDAFVSYSTKDEDFVMNHLVPEIEKSEPDKIKIYLHVRDAANGGAIPKQSSDSFRNARRTVIVFSQNSSNSNIYFKRAEKENMPVIVLYGDVDLNEINNTGLGIHLTSDMCIKWGEPCFGEKLRDMIPPNY